jgi:hypothetical protein
VKSQRSSAAVPAIKPNDAIKSRVEEPAGPALPEKNAPSAPQVHAIKTHQDSISQHQAKDSVISASAVSHDEATKSSDKVIGATAKGVDSSPLDTFQLLAPLDEWIETKKSTSKECNTEVKEQLPFEATLAIKDETAQLKSQTKASAEFRKLPKALQSFTIETANEVNKQINQYMPLIARDDKDYIVNNAFREFQSYSSLIVQGLTQ